MKTFNMNNCKPSVTPLSPSLKLVYVTQSRHDIAFPVNLLTRFMLHPTKNHSGATKQIIKYLAGTTDFGIHYERGNKCQLMCYSDSDWGWNLMDKKNTTWAPFTIGLGIVCEYKKE